MTAAGLVQVRDEYSIVALPSALVGSPAPTAP